MFNIFGNLKALGAMVAGLLALFGLWKYNNKVNELEETKSYADKKDEEAQAMKETVEVQSKVHKQDKANQQMKFAVSKNETAKERIKSAKKEESAKVIDSSEDDTVFNLKA